MTKKQKITTVALLIFSVFLLSGCGLLMGEGKKLTDNDYAVTGVQSLILDAYCLTYTNGQSALFFTWDVGDMPDANTLSLCKLKETGTGSFKYLNSTSVPFQDTTYRIESIQDYASIEDAYILTGCESADAGVYSSLSNIILRGSIDRIDAANEATFPMERLFTNDGEAGRVTESFTNGNTGYTEAAPWLWVPVSNNIWICLGRYY